MQFGYPMESLWAANSKRLPIQMKKETLTYISRSASSTFAVRCFYMAAGFATTLLMTRWLGVEKIGVYNFVLSWVLTSVVLVKFGFEQYLVRELASNHLNDRKSLWNLSFKFVAGTSAIVMGFIATSIPYLRFSNGEITTSLWLSLALIPLLALLGIYRAAFKSQQRIIESQVPEYMFRPSILIISLLSFIWLGVQPDSGIAIVTNVAATSIVVAFCAFRSPTREWKKESNKTPRNLPSVIYATSPFILIAGIHIINQRTDRLMLGSIIDMASVGTYSVAIQMATVVNFAIVGINAALSPVIATLGTETNRANLQTTIWKVTNIASVIAILILLGLILFSPWALKLCGAGFESSYYPLVILGIGQLANVTFGPAAVLLSMMKHEKIVSACVACSALINLVFNIALIPVYGTIGAAIATSLSMIILNLSLAIMAKRLTGVSSSQFFRSIPSCARGNDE